MPEKRKFVNVSLAILEEDFELAYSVLIDYDFIGMEEALDKIILSFEEKNWNEEVKNDLITRLNEVLPNNVKIIKEEVLEEKNWIEEWEKNTEPIKISENICITPEWKKDQIDANIKVIINPKMSFGTGQHATTKLMAQFIEKIIHPDQVWIDAGTGTGVLAILAAKMEAKKIYAFDNDEWSFENALENAELNKVADKIDIKLSTIEEYDFPKANVIVANMFLNLITASLNKFYKSLCETKGKLLVSGILIYDRDKLLSKAKEAGFILKDEVQEDEWCAFLFVAS